MERYGSVTPSVGTKRRLISPLFSLSNKSRPTMRSRSSPFVDYAPLLHVGENRLFAPVARLTQPASDPFAAPHQDAHSSSPSEPRSFPLVHQESETKARFNGIEMSQLTMSQSTFMENHDLLSVRSTSQSARPATTYACPPLHQSSCSSSESKCKRSISSALRSVLGSSSMTRQRSTVQQASSNCMDPRREEFSRCSASLQGCKEPSRSILRMPIHGVSASASKKSFIQFRNGRCLNLNPYTQSSFETGAMSQESSGCLPRQARLVDRGSISHPICSASNKVQSTESTNRSDGEDVTVDCEKRLRQMHGELEAKFSEQARLIKERTDTLEKNMSKILQDREEEMQSRLALVVNRHLETLNRATTSHNERIEKVAQGHLKVISDYKDAALSKLGEVTEAAKVAIMSKGSELIISVLPSLQDQAKAIVCSLFPKTIPKGKNHKVLQPGLFLQSVGNHSSSRPPRRPRSKKEKESNKKEARNEVTILRRSLRSKRRQEAANDSKPGLNQAFQNVTPPNSGKEPSAIQKRRVSSSEKAREAENHDRPAMSERSSVTLVEEPTPIRLADLIDSKQYPEKKESHEIVGCDELHELDKEGVPLEVVLSQIGCTSPLSSSAAQVIEDDCSSPLATRKRDYNPTQLKPFNAKRSRSNGRRKGFWKDSPRGGDPFDFSSSLSNWG